MGLKSKFMGVAVAALAVAATTVFPASQAMAQDKKVVLMHLEPEGSPWDDLAWQGMVQLEAETGAEIKRIGGIPQAAAEQQVRAMAIAGFNPIVIMNDEDETIRIR